MIFEAGTSQAIKPMVFQTKVEEVIQRTYDTKSFRFKKPPEFKHLAGQWAYFSIKIEGTQKLHHFTISSSPTEDYLEFTKKITDSEFSQALNKFKGGEWTLINGPFGDFTYSGENIKIGALTGGIGITPLRSICRYCVDKNLPTSVVMLYANHTEKDIVFRDEFDRIQKKDPHIVVKDVLTKEPGWPGLKGHVDGEMIKAQIPDYRERTFYICGPPSMNEAMKKALKSLNVPDSRIKLEDFTGYK
jgi:ferredoxin-NADP reductase